MENFFAIFPQYGRNVSTLWKKRPDFSMLWKNFSPIFHTMEEMFPWCGKLGFWAVIECAMGARGCSPMAVERSARRPLSTVERDRPKRPGKWCPMQSGSALSRSRLGCGVVARPFSGREVGDCSRSQVRWGRCVWSVDLLGGLKKYSRD
jgi:hypothetical protein